MGEHYCEGHALLSLVCSVAKHKALVSGTSHHCPCPSTHLQQYQGSAPPGRPSGRASCDRPFAGIVIPDIFDCIPHNLLIIDMRLACNLSTHHNHTSFCDGLASNLGIRILL